MTDLAYMVREDWAQLGTAMVPSSAHIRSWLGEGPFLFAVTDVRKFTDSGRNADVEAADYIAPGQTNRRVVNIADLVHLAEGDDCAHIPVVVLHPFGHRDCEVLRKAIGSGAFGRVFVMIWSLIDPIRPWLDARGATDVHTGASLPAPDPLQVAAAELMVNEQYNGLSSGRGKEAVVQLLRVFSSSGYPLDEGAWLRAFFAAGGTFPHADSVSKFVRETKSGVRHRVKQAFRPEILDVLRERVSAS